jgi:hypothetical protein
LAASASKVDASSSARLIEILVAEPYEAMADPWSGWPGPEPDEDVDHGLCEQLWHGRAAEVIHAIDIRDSGPSQSISLALVLSGPALVVWDDFNALVDHSGHGSRSVRPERAANQPGGLIQNRPLGELPERPVF